MIVSNIAQTFYDRMASQYEKFYDERHKSRRLSSLRSCQKRSYLRS